MKPVVILGVFVADTAYRAQRQPRMGETILGTSFKLGPGGKGSNQAVAAGALQGRQADQHQRAQGQAQHPVQRAEEAAQHVAGPAQEHSHRAGSVEVVRGVAGSTAACAPGCGAGAGAGWTGAG